MGVIRRYPYTEQDGKDFISAMLSADENETVAFAITVDNMVIGSIGIFGRTTFIGKLLNQDILLPKNIGEKTL